MKNLLMVILATILLSSCRIFNKNLNKTRESAHTEADIKTVASGSAVVNNTTSATRTITTEENAPAEIKGAVITATGSAKDLEGGKIVHTETTAGTLDIRKDPITGAVTATATTKDKRIPVNKKTTTIENINTISAAISASNMAEEADIIQDTKKNNKELVVSKTPGTNYLAIGFISAIILIGTIWVIIWWRSRKNSSPVA